MVVGRLDPAILGSTEHGLLSLVGESLDNEDPPSLGSSGEPVW